MRVTRDGFNSLLSDARDELESLRQHPDGEAHTSEVLDLLMQRRARQYLIGSFEVFEVLGVAKMAAVFAATPRADLFLTFKGFVVFRAAEKRFSEGQSSVEFPSWEIFSTQLKMGGDVQLTANQAVAAGKQDVFLLALFVANRLASLQSKGE